MIIFYLLDFLTFFHKDFHMAEEAGLFMPPPISLTFLSWNCRGLGQAASVNYLYSLVRKYKPDCLFLMETKGKKDVMERLSRKLRYYNFEIVEATESAGGLIMMWKEDLLMSCVWKTKRIICCKLKPSLDAEEWLVYGCYGTPYLREKESFWNSLTD